MGWTVTPAPGPLGLKGRSSPWPCAAFAQAGVSGEVDERPVPRRGAGQVHRPGLRRHGAGPPPHLPAAHQAARPDAVAAERRLLADAGRRRDGPDGPGPLQAAGADEPFLPSPNAWIGVSAEDQKRASLRVPRWPPRPPPSGSSAPSRCSARSGRRAWTASTGASSAASPASTPARSTSAGSATSSPPVTTRARSYSSSSSARYGRGRMAAARAPAGMPGRLTFASASTRALRAHLARQVGAERASQRPAPPGSTHGRAPRHRPAATRGEARELRRSRRRRRRLPTSLYSQEQIRDLISDLRKHEPPAAALAAQRASTSSLRQRLETACAEITRLRTENRSLRDQLARQLGLHRMQPASKAAAEPQ